MRKIREIAINLAKKNNEPPDRTGGTYSFSKLGPYLKEKPKLQAMTAYDYLEPKRKKQQERYERKKKVAESLFGKSYATANSVQRQHRDLLKQTIDKIKELKIKTNSELGGQWYTIREKKKKGAKPSRVRVPTYVSQIYTP